MVVKQAVANIIQLTIEFKSHHAEEHNENIDNIVMALRCGIQFLGNFVTNNNENKSLIWKDVAPYFQ